ncbi:mechanosensitive ion channel family protein [Nannocystis bainbridge]|uniref:Mechanosensitive ion channel family protein n=1 Tax=Nannocystis bainbridge TaxID=2995303 RepID=A0ABT5E3N5_9BACT|nr:mechanosensitive ion channel family protein [Nannocystis bainbridge]MDC0720475.1 mechanosensitive ion channel family protein [Nannocystis bainbridge]
MVEAVESLLERTWLGITGLQWLAAAVILVALTPTLMLVRRVATRRLRKHAVRTESDVDDTLASLIERTRGWFFTLIGMRLASVTLDLPERWDHRIHVALIIGGMVQGGIWASTIVRYLVDRRFARHVHAEGASPQVTPIAQALLRLVGLVIVWSIVMLVALSAMGIDITALVAGLGIGGVAIALAVQKVLSDILASVSIIVDKPFAPGDSIQVGQLSGTVRRIGMRSTVLAASGGEELVLSNNDLLSSRIQNFTRMQERRVVLRIGVVYTTPQELLERLPDLLRAAVERREHVRLDRAALVNLGESAIEYEVVYWVTTADYSVFVALHQQLLLELLREMRGLGYEFAFPSRTLYVVPPEEGLPANPTEPASPAS